jgi:hypothetical protein
MTVFLVACRFRRTQRTPHPAEIRVARDGAANTVD